MRRGTLIYRSHRQLTLARTIHARQPLLARLTRHQQFPHAFGLPVARAIPVSPAYTETLLLIDRNFHPAIFLAADAGDAITDPVGVDFMVRTADLSAHVAPLIDDADKSAVRTINGRLRSDLPTTETAAPDIAVRAEAVGAQFIAPAGAEPTSDPPAPAGAMNCAPTASDVPEVEAMVEADLEPLAVQREEVQPPVSMDVTEQIAPLPEVHASADEATAPPLQEIDAKQLAESGSADEIIPSGPGAKPPIETVRPRRPRRGIQELTAQAGPRSASSTPAIKKETAGPQRNTQVQRPEMKTTGEGEMHADDLFLPSNTDRSPQAWLARLMGKSLPAQEDVAAHTASMAEEDAPPDVKGIKDHVMLSESEASEATGMSLGHVMLSESEASESGMNPAHVMLSESEASEATGMAREETRDASFPLSMTRSPLSMTRLVDGLSLDEQARSQPPVVGQPRQRRQEETRQREEQSRPQVVEERGGQEDMRQREEQSQPQAAQATNLRTIAAMPGIPGASGTAGMPTTVETSRAAKTVQARPAEPLSARTRRFLRPLVGIDPDSARVHRDAQAARLVDAYHADAVTQGNNVELAAEYAGAMETPETLGLLAHELTHVARLREPGFVPPIAQTQTQTQPASVPQHRPPTSAPPITTDEEALALHVERQVRQTAETGTMYIVGPPLAGGLGAAGGLGHEHDRWGGLPAPWEPLPGWLTTPTVPSASTTMEPNALPVPVSAPATGTGAPVGQGMASSNDNSHQANGHGGAEVQRAGKERAVGEYAALAASVSASPTQEMRAPEPDLDELARQVYSILRNRLEVERRRHR